MSIRLVTLLAVVSAGCADNGPERLVSGSVQGSINGLLFTVVYGIATTYASNTRLIEFGDSRAELHCGSLEELQAQREHVGDTIVIDLPFSGFSLGNQDAQFFLRDESPAPDLIKTFGGGAGIVTISGIGDTIAGSFVFESPANGVPSPVTAVGAFEVVHCPDP